MFWFLEGFELGAGIGVATIITYAFLWLVTIVAIKIADRKEKRHGA